MSLARRGRSTAVLGFLLSGALGIISSTQTWLVIARVDAGAAIDVSGVSALPLLAPLSLAVLALGIALSIVGPVLRLIFGVLATATALLLSWSTLQLIVSDRFDAVASAVTETTGLAGADAVSDVAASIDLTAWPILALIGWVVLLLASIVVLATSHRWKSGGRRYEKATAHAVADSGPVDAIDSWDDLSRGTDPTR